MPWYHINVDGNQEGPFQFADLAGRFQSKQIDADTFVWHGKKVKEWSKIGDVPGLQQKLNRPLKQKLNSRGSVVDLNFPERKTSTRSRAGTVPLQNVSRYSRSRTVQKHRRYNSAMGERMVQIANLLVKTQDELERQKKENEIILNENREQKSKMADLESKLKKEMQSKQTLRKQWKKAQSEYESEIKQYQSQLDIFFAAETELNDVFASPTPWLGTLGGIGGGQFGYAESVFSDDKSIQINLSYVE